MPKFISPFISLKFREFRLLWLGSLISNIGTQMQIVAISWHIYTITKSAFSLALIGAARLIPLLIISPFSGIIADRYDRRKITLLSQTIQCITTFILAYLTFTKNVNAVWIYLVLIIGSFAYSVDSPSRQAIIPTLVPAEFLPNALGLNVTMFNSAIVIGPSIAGFVIAYLGIGMVYLFNAFSYIAVIIALIMMKPLKKILQSERLRFSLKSVSEGFIFVFKNPLISSSMLLDFFVMFFSSATILMPIYANDILKVGPQGLGLLYAAPSIGSVLTGFIYSSFHKVNFQGKIMLVSVLIYGLATIIFGISRIFPLSLIALAVAGAGDSVSAITRNSIRQLLTPDSMRGRMSSISLIFYSGGPQLGEIEAGVISGFLGATFSVVTDGVGAVLTTIILAFIYPQIRRYQGHELQLTG